MTELGRRAVACRRWRWLPGMRTQWIRIHEGTLVVDHGSIPDLTDPATRGCLMSLVQDLSLEGHIRLQLYGVSGREWWECAIRSLEGSQFFRGPTAEDVLVQALEWLDV